MVKMIFLLIAISICQVAWAYESVGLTPKGKLYLAAEKYVDANEIYSFSKQSDYSGIVSYMKALSKAERRMKDAAKEMAAALKEFSFPYSEFETWASIAERIVYAQEIHIEENVDFGRVQVNNK